MADTVAETLYSILVREYNLELSSDQFKELVTHQTTAIYQELVRADATMPRVDFGLADLRAMDYLAKSDLVYLGKYVNDEALKVRILEYLRVHYAGEGRAIGNSPKEIQAFLDEFRDELDLTKYQLRRIIDTTVSRARVFGQVNGLRAAGAKTFEIAGPYDNLTCPFCKTMVGRVFSVAVEIADQDKFINAGPEGASAIRPFLKGSLTLEQIEEMGDEALQAAGFAAPPYHPVCRHRLIVRDFYENLDEIPYAIE
jgi:hypothetical protein